MKSRSENRRDEPPGVALGLVPARLRTREVLAARRFPWRQALGPWLERCYFARIPTRRLAALPHSHAQLRGLTRSPCRVTAFLPEDPFFAPQLLARGGGSPYAPGPPIEGGGLEGAWRRGRWPAIASWSRAGARWAAPSCPPATRTRRCRPSPRPCWRPGAACSRTSRRSATSARCSRSSRSSAPRPRPLAAGRPLELDTANLGGHAPDLAARRQTIRGSFLLAPGLLHRHGRAVLPRPGGDRIGRRRVDTHLHALRLLGAEVEVGERHVRAAPRRPLPRRPTSSSTRRA